MSFFSNTFTVECYCSIFKVQEKYIQINSWATLTTLHVASASLLEGNLFVRGAPSTCF